jgi:hypothetical protein
MKIVLKKLIDDTQASGGILLYGNGTCAPLGDPMWVDLGDTVLKAKEALEAAGESVSLDIHDFSDKFQTCEDYDPVPF